MWWHDHIHLVLNGSLHGRVVSGRAGLGDQEAALVLHGEGLGEGGHFARLLSFQGVQVCVNKQKLPAEYRTRC